MNVLLMRISRGSWERVEIGTWIAQSYMEYAHDAMGGIVANLAVGNMDKEPTTCARNTAVALARENGFNVLVMVDNDMGPHQDFLRTALHHIHNYPGCVVGSPYRGQSPKRLVQVMHRSGGPGEASERFGSSEAARQRGVQPVGMIGTGLIACDMRAFDRLKPPYFDYDYTAPARETVADTEDFYFSRNFTAAGGRVYCAWSCWSTHMKTEEVGKPEE